MLWQLIRSVKGKKSMRSDLKAAGDMQSAPVKKLF
jgi:hypothetical protein